MTGEPSAGSIDSVESGCTPVWSIDVYIVCTCDSGSNVRFVASLC